jgi:purine-cytosine permease-like protein
MTINSIDDGVLAGEAGGVQEYAPFKVEQRGIDLIPDAERKMTPAGLFWLWAGAVFNVEFFFYGFLISSFGLSFGQCLLAIVVGNLFYAFLGLASLQGPAVGTTAFVVSRAPFGRNGNRVVALFNWITQVGFEVEGVFLVVATVLFLFSRYGAALPDTGKVAVVILAAAVQLVVPLFGHATLTKVLRYLSYVFIVLFAVLAVLVIQGLHSLSFDATASWGDWTTALVVIISVGGLGWTENGNDYSRYLPASTPKWQTFWAATLGPGIPSVLLEILGALAATVTTKTLDIQGLGIPQAFPDWFVLPFLLLAIVQLFAINTIDLYSSGVTLQALGVPVKRWGAVVIDTVIVAIVTGLVLFQGDFYHDLTGFFLYIVVWLGPWFGILIVDYWLRRGRYDPASLAAPRGGLYWRNGGIHWPALIAQGLGMIASLLWINATFAVPSFVGPLSNAVAGLEGSDFSWLLGVVVGGLIYWALAGARVRREAAAPTS